MNYPWEHSRKAEPIDYDAENQRMFALLNETGFIPIITNDDIDKFLISDAPESFRDRDYRNGFNEWEVDDVLYFLGWVAENKSLDFSLPAHDRFGYEAMLYAYHDAADAIAAL